MELAGWKEFQLERAWTSTLYTDDTWRDGTLASKEDEVWFNVVLGIPWTSCGWKGKRERRCWGHCWRSKGSNEMRSERGTRCADWSASSSPSRAAFQSKLILTIPVAFFDLRQWSVVGRCMRSAVGTERWTTGWRCLLSVLLSKARSYVRFIDESQLSAICLYRVDR